MGHIILLSQNTSESANDFSEAARDRDRTEVSTVERQALEFVYSICNSYLVSIL